MSNIKISFEYPYLLLLLIPCVVLAFIPFLKLPKHRRHSNARILSLVLHIIILSLTTLVVSGFRIQIENSVKTNDVIFLVDQSYSLETKEKNVDNYLTKVLKSYDSNYRVGIVNFAKDYDYVSKLSLNANDVLKSYLDSNAKVNTSATDFANALYYAKSLFDNPKNGRIIVISDGLQTDDNGILACKSIAGDGVTIDCVYMENENWKNDAIISNVAFLEEPELNSYNKLQISVQKFGINQVDLTVEDNGTVVYQQTVSIIQENEVLEVPITFTTDGLHEVKVTIQNSSDSISSNNVYYTYASILGAEKILVVEGETGNGADVQTMLEGFSYECEVVSPASMSSVVLDSYGQVILVNVDYADLPTSFDRVLDEYVKTGGNLFTTGGKNTYNLGSMEDTLFEDFMPINFEAPDYRPQVCVFVIDNSSSMEEQISGSSKTKMTLAKEATIAAVNALNNYDYVGVITFAATAELVCDITPVSRKADIIADINEIEPSLGTNYLPAFNMADSKLVVFNETNVKNVLFISDGNPQDDQYKAKIAGMYAKDIVTSAIAIGDEINGDEMLELAQRGGGSYFHVTSANQMSTIMIEALNSFSKEEFIEEEGVPVIARHGTIMSGIRSLPELLGYNRVSAKAGSSTYLTIDDNPIYTTWDYHDGIVGCFMGDLSEEYAPEYFSNNQGSLLVRNIVNSMSKSNGLQREMSVNIEDDNYSKKIEVYTTSSGGNNSIRGKVTLPNDTVKDVTFALTANNTYSAVLDECTFPGIYSIELTKSTSEKEVTQTEYFSFSFSEEYIFEAEGIDFINQLSKISKHGKLFTLDDELFTDEIEYDVYEFNPQIPFLIIALCLFLFDILIRKFKFKWLVNRKVEEKSAQTL